MCPGESHSASAYENNEVANLKHKQTVKEPRVISSNSIRLGRVTARRFIVQFSEMLS